MKHLDDCLFDLRAAVLNEVTCQCQEAYCQHVMDLVDAASKAVSAWEEERVTNVIPMPNRPRVGGGL